MSRHDSAFWGLTIAKYYTWPFPKSGATDGGMTWPDTFLSKWFKITPCWVSTKSKTDRDGDFAFFNVNNFSYILKNCKQQFTAAICLNKGCPDYPRWEDSFQQRLIKIFNSSTLNNSLYCTVAVRPRQILVMAFAVSHPVAVWLSEACLWVTKKEQNFIDSVHGRFKCDMKLLCRFLDALVVSAFWRKCAEIAARRESWCALMLGNRTVVYTWCWRLYAAAMCCPSHSYSITVRHVCDF